MKYKCVIFDLDGVLVDACDWHRIALNEALKQVCNYEIPLEEHLSIFNGIPTKKKLEILNNKKIILKEDNDLIENLKQEKTIDIINKHAFKRQEKIEILSFLKNSNILAACYTNSIRQTAELMLQKTGIKHMFDLIVTNQDVKKPKPDPEGYFYCFNYFHLNPEECIIIEDSPKGIAAAKASGAKVIEVKGVEDVNISVLKDFIK